jgi:hypothetical protein
MAIIESKAGISISWCIGTKEMIDVLKCIGVSACLEAEIRWAAVAALQLASSASGPTLCGSWHAAGHQLHAD